VEDTPDVPRVGKSVRASARLDAARSRLDLRLRIVPRTGETLFSKHKKRKPFLFPSFFFSGGGGGEDKKKRSDDVALCVLFGRLLQLPK